MNDWAYFDYAASTPIDPEILEIYQQSLQKHFANSGAFYDLAKESANKIFDARKEFASALLATEADEIIWTASATEANNLAIKGVCLHKDVREARLITLQSEHKSVLDAAGSLLRQNVKVEVLPVQSNGLVDLNQLENCLKEKKTTLVSIMAVNNETGVIQPLTEIANLAHKFGAKFHIDATQALGKIPINLQEWDCDLASFSAHKVFAPKGIGALFVRKFPKVRLAAQIHGGGQERGLRAGTLATSLIIAFSAACLKAVKNQPNWQKHSSIMRQQLLNNLPAKFKLNLEQSTPQCVHILNIACNKSSLELLTIANQNKIAISAGSACTTQLMQNQNGAHPLIAMGKNEIANKSLRISISHLTKQWEIDKLIAFFQQI